MRSPSPTSPDVSKLLLGSPTLNSTTGARRGTVADVRSLQKLRKICFEGFMWFNEDGKKYWFILDTEGSFLRGYARRPKSDEEKPSKNIPLDDVIQVIRSKKNVEKFCFELCDSEKSCVASLKCEDERNLLWWLHGFQRRIFDQTKGLIKKMKMHRLDEEEKDPRKNMGRATTMSLISPRAQLRVNSSWMTCVQACIQGRRRNMEDETYVNLNLNEEFKIPLDFGSLSLFCVFDGHAGRECAEFSKDFMAQNLVDQKSFKEGKFEEALTNAFVQTDSEFREWAIENENISGTTAIGVLLRTTKLSKELICANSGDCRCVLARGKVAHEMSKDHKPDREDEKLRIEEAGGWIETQEVLNIPKLYALGLENTEILDEHQKLVGWVKVSKVMGSLGMTRSFGDILIKDHLTENFECVFEGGFKGELILSHPEISKDIVVKDDAFMIIACDGLWDVFSSQEAVDFVWKEQEEGVTKSEIASHLVEAAYKRGTLDNVSVVIVFFSI